MQRILKLILPLAGKWALWMNVFLGIFAGLCNFLFINQVTRVIALITAGNYTAVSQKYLLIFFVIILLFIWTRRTLSLAIVRLSQQLFWSLRKQILSLVLNANNQQLANRKDKIYAAVVNDVNILTQASLTIIDFFTSLMLAVSCLLYMLSISWVLFLITLGTAALGIAAYRFSSRKNLQEFESARNLENGFLKSFNTVLDGFKEIYMDPKKGKAIYEKQIMGIAEQAYKNNITAFTGFINNQIVGRVLFYILISVILLYFSVALHIRTANVVSFVFTLLYLLGAIELIMALLPGIVRARVAADRLMNLKQELENARFNNPMPAKYILKSEFVQIAVKDLEFYYGEDEGAFRIGPASLTAQKGEVIFIYGGNGSGKTTFIHTLLGLCIPSAGDIRLNGVLINNDNYPDYRTIFSVVFSDFYLFDELLGIAHPDMEKWHYYLRLFELEGKVQLSNNCFSTTALSTGQRKRLALIAALLEEKPVLIIDEWAADQDPYFRRKFYTEILPILKKDGTTVIAITHDDKYFYCADKLYKMDGGKLIAENVNIHAASAIS
jgi:putative ATP-binding cassette transporter